MPDPRRETARAQYFKARAEFEKLETQDKTAFVVEATFATLGQAVEDAGRGLADVLERVASYDFGWGESAWNRPMWGTDADAGGPNPATPPTSAKRARSTKTDEDEA